MKTVLIVGGAGYIGSHAARRLVADGHQAVVFDDLSTGWRDAVQFGPFHHGDLLCPAHLEAAFEAHAIDAVMHFGARSQVGESVSHPALYWRTNLAGSLNLLAAMSRAGVERLVFSSTAATYGEPDLDLISETCPLAPTNPYGATKVAVERMIADFAHAHGITAVVFRYFNVAGAAPAGIGEQHRPETHLIPLVLDTAAGVRSHISLFGDDYPTYDGTCIRDYIHVEDVARAHIAGFEWLGGAPPGSVTTMNLGTGRGHSVREVIDVARQVTERSILTKIAARRAGDPPRLVCDPSRARAVLGWRAEHDLSRMIGDAWRWHNGPGFSSSPSVSTRKVP